MPDPIPAAGPEREAWLSCFGAPGYQGDPGCEVALVLKTEIDAVVAEFRRLDADLACARAHVEQERARAERAEGEVATLRRLRAICERWFSDTRDPDKTIDDVMIAQRDLRREIEALRANEGGAR